MAANGHQEDDGRDRRSYYEETVVIPSREVKAKTSSGSKKGAFEKTKTKKGAYRPAFAASNKQNNTTVQRNNKVVMISIGVLAAVLVLCISIGFWFYFTTTADNGLIMDNTYAAGINIGGKTPEEAVALLSDKLSSNLQNATVTIVLPDTTLELIPENTKPKLDVNLLVNDAFQYGRTGSRSDRVAAMAGAAMTRRDIGLLSYMTLDTSYIQSAIGDLLNKNGSSLTQATIQIEGTRPVEPNPKDEEEAAKVFQTLTITTGTQSRTFDTESLYNQVLDAYNHGKFDPITVEYTTEEPAAVELEALIEKYCIASVDAELNEDDFTITDEIWGYGFDETVAANLLNIAQYGETITLSLTYQEPDITREKLENELFKDVLATADTIYYLDPNRTNNLELACKAINNYVLKPGEAFSFNEVLGERTAEKGYMLAGAYVEGETVDQLGGGICQVASTLYYCALYADLTIIEREEHMFTADYLPLGMDATVNWGTIDFRFRNNTDYPIRIEAKAEDSYVTVTLTGTDDKNYYVEMDYVILEEYQWETVEKEMEEDNEDGYVDGEVIYNGWMGYSVDTYKYKYDKQTDELLYCELESHSEYSKRDKTICKIISPEDETTVPEEGESSNSEGDNSSESGDDSD